MRKFVFLTFPIKVYKNISILEQSNLEDNVTWHANTGYFGTTFLVFVYVVTH